MAIFGIQTDREDKKFKDFIVSTNERLTDQNLLRNPFQGKISSFSEKKLHVINIEPIYFNFSLLVWIPGVFIFAFKGLHWLLIPVLLVGSLGLAWTRYFFYLMLRLGLKKSGSESKIKLLSNKKLMEVFFA